MGEMWKDGRTPKVQCTAKTSSGYPCKRPPIKGGTVCRTHGGAAPQVRAAAQVRILMASDMAARKLIELMSSPKVDDRVKLAAARDLLDRANLSGTQAVEVTVEKGKSFEDFVLEASIEIDGDSDDELDSITGDVVDAEVVEDDPVRNRHDDAVFHGVERAAQEWKRPQRRMTDEERDAVEAVAVAAKSSPEAWAEYEAMLLAKDNGTYNPSSRGVAQREAAARRRAEGGPRRARNSRADLG